MQFCGPDIGKESGLPEITTESAASRSDRKASRLLLFFDTLPDNVTIKCMPKEGGNIRQIADIERDYMHYFFRQMSPQKSTYSIGYVYVILHIDNTDIFMGCCFTLVRRF